MKPLFRQIIADFHTSVLRVGKKRDLKIPLHTGKIISLLGPRRSGKSYFLFGMMQDLIKEGVEKTSIVYINFEDERIDISGEGLQVIIEAYLDLYPMKILSEVYFFFDEIQNIKNWEGFVRRLSDTMSQNIFITGSNAKLLSREIATTLRGRSLSFEILPLSFSEFVRFQYPEIQIASTVGKAQILHLQREYLKWGGFPELLSLDESLKIKTLQEYSDVMIYRDIIDRYQVRDLALLKAFIRHLLQTTTKEYSINKIGNTLKSLGFRFDKNSLYGFLDSLDMIYFGKSISKWEYALSRQTLKKWYIFDTGFLNALSFTFSDNWGKLLENVVFIELYRRHGENISFLKNGSETDFITNTPEKEIYQVCYDLTPENQEREIKGCLDAMDHFGMETAFLITSEQEQTLVVGGKTIQIMPFYRWILEKKEK